MSMQFSFGKRLLRAAMSLGFLGCLTVQGNIQGEAAAGERPAASTAILVHASEVSPNTCRSDALVFIASDSMTARMEIGVPVEVGAAFEDEDSVEMFRFDVQQRTFNVDRAVAAAKAAPKIARNTRLSISPPLLV
jgi:hypothetical protein